MVAESSCQLETSLDPLQTGKNHSPLPPSCHLLEKVNDRRHRGPIYSMAQPWPLSQQQGTKSFAPMASHLPALQGTRHQIRYNMAVSFTFPICIACTLSHTANKQYKADATQGLGKDAGQERVSTYQIRGQNSLPMGSLGRCRLHGNQ